MENYNEIAKRFIKFHQEKSMAERQLSAITTALIGAVGEGYKVTALNYNESELKDLDLSYHKEIFTESGKTVDELESSLLTIFEKQNLSQLYLNNELELLKFHYSMCPKCFLGKYIFIPNHVITRLGDEFNPKMTEIMSESIDSGKQYSMMTTEEGIMLFSEYDNDMSEIKKYLKRDDDVISYEIQDLEIDEVTQYYLGYLYKQQPEGNYGKE